MHPPSFEKQPSVGDRFVRLASLFYGAMFFLAVFCTYMWGDWKNWFPDRSLPDTVIDLLLGVLIGIVFVGLSRLLTTRITSFQELTDEFSAYFQGMQTKHVLMLAFFSGIAEETLFRGAIQPLWGWVLTSLLFGFLHSTTTTGKDGKPKWLWSWTVFATCFGFCIGSVYKVRGGILLPITTHVFVNAWNLHYLSLYKDREKNISNGS